MSNVATCAACGSVFRSVSAFDGHRTGSYATLPDSKHGARPSLRRCLDAAGMEARGMALNARGQWTLGAMPDGLHGEAAADDE